MLFAASFASVGGARARVRVDGGAERTGSNVIILGARLPREGQESEST